MPFTPTPSTGPGGKPDVMGAIGDAAKSVKESLSEMAKTVVPKITEMFKSAMSYLKKAPEKLRGFLGDIKKPESIFGLLFKPKNPEENAGVMNKFLGFLFKNMSEAPKAKKADTTKPPETLAMEERTKPVQKQKEKTPQQQLDEIMAQVNNYEELYAKYKAGPDGSKIKEVIRNKLKYLALVSIFNKESGNWSPDVRTRLVNLKAINYDPKNPSKNNAYGKRLANEKITPPVAFIKQSKSETLFGNGLGTLEQFKATLMEKLQPGSRDPEVVRLKKAVMVLSCSALGAFQIVPIEHFKSMGWIGSDGVPSVEHLYNYLKNPKLQDKMYARIIDDIGKRYDWNLPIMAVAYYSGPKTADRINSGEIALSHLSSTQSHGYESPAEYAKGAETAATREIKKEQSKS